MHGQPRLKQAVSGAGRPAGSSHSLLPGTQLCVSVSCHGCPHFKQDYANKFPKGTALESVQILDTGRSLSWHTPEGPRSCCPFPYLASLIFVTSLQSTDKKNTSKLLSRGKTRTRLGHSSGLHRPQWQAQGPGLNPQHKSGRGGA